VSKSEHVHVDAVAALSREVFRHEMAAVDLQHDPQAEYVLSGADGEFMLDTATDGPAGPRIGPTEPSGAGRPTIRLEPGRSYCFGIRSPAGEERRGTFTTLDER
jgi:hypothetical protein